MDNSIRLMEIKSNMRWMMKHQAPKELIPLYEQLHREINQHNISKSVTTIAQLDKLVQLSYDLPCGDRPTFFADVSVDELDVFIERVQWISTCKSYEETVKVWKFISLCLLALYFWLN